MELLLISPKQAYATRRLELEARLQNIGLRILEIGELRNLNFAINPREFDALYIRQAYTEFAKEVPATQLQGLIHFARAFKDAGKVVVDRSIAEGDLGRGKYEALSRLGRQGIAVPQTNLLSTSLLKNPAHYQQGMAYPIIAKWNYGFGAKHTYFVKTEEDFKKIEHKYEPGQILVQEFIRADFEYKVITVGYKSLPVIIKLKINHDKFLPDLATARILAAAEAPQVADLAERGAKALKRELAKVDILEAGGQLYLLEANRWPGFQYFENTSKYNVAREFLRYLSEACKKT